MIVDVVAAGHVERRGEHPRYHRDVVHDGVIRERLKHRRDGVARTGFGRRHAVVGGTARHERRRAMHEEVATRKRATVGERGAAVVQETIEQRQANRDHTAFQRAA